MNDQDIELEDIALQEKLHKLQPPVLSRAAFDEADGNEDYLQPPANTQIVEEIPEDCIISCCRWIEARDADDPTYRRAMCSYGCGSEIRYRVDNAHVLVKICLPCAVAIAGGRN